MLHQSFGLAQIMLILQNSTYALGVHQLGALLCQYCGVLRLEGKTRKGAFSMRLILKENPSFAIFTCYSNPIPKSMLAWPEHN